MSRVRAGGGYVDAEDYTQYEREHRRIFGHTPIADVSGRRLCCHPMHDALTQTMNGAGVGVHHLPFAFHNRRHDDFLTEDEAEIRPEHRRRDA